MPPSASSALVNIAEDAELRLVRLLADASESTGPTFVQNCEACILNGNATQLMLTILEEKGAIDALVSLEEEAISAVSLLAALLDRVKSAESSKLVNALAEAVISSTEDATKAVSLLASLYNMRSDPSEKVALLVQMFNVAASRQPSLLDSNASVLAKWLDATKLREMLDEWNVQPSDRRALFRAAAEVSTSPLMKQRFALLLVETYAASDIDNQGIEFAEKAAIGAIEDPVSLFVEQRNILSLPAIQALQKDSAPLHSLLKVFQEGKLEDYHTFLKSHGGEAILSKWKLSADDCNKYIRILSLCSLAAEHEEIPYKLVADTLQTMESDVEQWVISAVSSGLLSAKMDQLQQQVIVERCVVRKFDMEQWRALQSRLQVWKQNVGGILKAYKDSQLKQ